MKKIKKFLIIATVMSLLFTLISCKKNTKNNKKINIATENIIKTYKNAEYKYNFIATNSTLKFEKPNKINKLNYGKLIKKDNNYYFYDYEYNDFMRNSWVLYYDKNNNKIYYRYFDYYGKMAVNTKIKNIGEFDENGNYIENNKIIIYNSLGNEIKKDEIFKEKKQNNNLKSEKTIKNTTTDNIIIESTELILNNETLPSNSFLNKLPEIIIPEETSSKIIETEITYQDIINGKKIITPTNEFNPLNNINIETTKTNIYYQTTELNNNLLNINNNSNDIIAPTENQQNISSGYIVAPSDSSGGSFKSKIKTEYKAKFIDSASVKGGESWSNPYCLENNGAYCILNAEKMNNLTFKVAQTRYTYGDDETTCNLYIYGDEDFLIDVIEDINEANDVEIEFEPIFKTIKIQLEVNGATEYRKVYLKSPKIKKVKYEE